MSFLNKVGRPKKVNTLQVKLSEKEISTLLELVDLRHDRLLEDGYEDEWAYGQHAYSDMAQMYTIGAKLFEMKRKVRDE